MTIKKTNQATDYIKIRSFLWYNIDKILEGLSVNKSQNGNQSDDLFALNSEDKILPSSFFRKEVELKSKLQILQEEKESLGIYVSGNPLVDYQNLLRWVREVTYLSNLHLILVEKVKKIFTRKGTMMLVLTITNSEFEAEGIIFSKNAIRVSPKLEEKKIFWALGKLDQKQKKEEVKTEDDLDIKEYDELSKLIIEDMSKLEDGVLPIIQDLGITLTEERKAILKNLDWSQVAQNPSTFRNQNKHKKVSENLKISQLEKSREEVVKIPKTVSKESLLQIKNLLHQPVNVDTIKVSLELETKTGYRKVKGDFFIDEKLLSRIKKMVEL